MSGDEKRSQYPVPLPLQEPHLWHQRMSLYEDKGHKQGLSWSAPKGLRLAPSGMPVRARPSFGTSRGRQAAMKRASMGKRRCEYSSKGEGGSKEGSSKGDKTRPDQTYDLIQ